MFPKFISKALKYTQQSLPSVFICDDNQADVDNSLKAERLEDVITPKELISMQNQLNEEERATKDPVSLSTTGLFVHTNFKNTKPLFNKTHNNDVFFPYEFLGDLPKYFQEKAVRTLGETPKRREKALTEMTKLVKDKGLDVSDAFMLCFLRLKKFDVKLALQKMEYFLNYIGSHNRGVSNCLEDITEFINLDIYHICPLRDEEGRFVMLTKLYLFDPAKMNFNKGLYSAARTVMKLMDEPANQIAGIVWIADCEGISVQWLKKLSISNFLMSQHVYFKCLPLRYQQVHVINDNGAMHFALKIFGKLLSSKMKNRIHIHGKDLNSLHKSVPKSLLPAEYGGTGQNWKPPFTSRDVIRAQIFSTS